MTFKRHLMAATRNPAQVNHAIAAHHSGEHSAELIVKDPEAKHKQLST